MTYYVPTSYTTPDPTVQSDGDAAFWGTLLEPGPEFKPSDIFPRFTDALFFCLDENAAPQKTGCIEPSKIASWLKAVTTDLAPDSDNVDAYNRILYDIWRIPAQIVTAGPGNPQAGEQIAVLDRYGFLMYLIALVRAEPGPTFDMFQKSISLFALVDPLTQQRFPMMPRSAFPLTADAEAVRLDAQVNSNVRARMQANNQLAAQHAQMLCDIERQNAVALASAFEATSAANF